MKNDEYEIRKSEITDIKDILKCYDSANMLHDEKMRSVGTYDIIKEVFDRTKSYNLYLNNEIIGWIAWEMKDNFCSLEALYIKIDMQNKGIGRYLMDFGIENLKKSGISIVLLSVLRNAPWAIEFYKKYGFEEITDLSKMNLNENCMLYAKEHDAPWECTMIKEIK